MYPFNETRLRLGAKVPLKETPWKIARPEDQIGRRIVVVFVNRHRSALALSAGRTRNGGIYFRASRHRSGEFVMQSHCDCTQSHISMSARRGTARGANGTCKRENLLR